MQEKFKESEKECLCPHCGAKMKGRDEVLSKGLVENLTKLREHVLKTKQNKVHLMKDLGLSKSGYNNFQKLRYFGLIAHYKNPETKKNELGYWLLTKRGNLFCKNKIEVPRKVLVFRNKIQDRSKEFISIELLLNSDTPYWYEKDDYDLVFMDVLDAEEIELPSFDNNGQGYMFK